MMELQEQIERLSRDKEKVVKEKSVMKTEISELYAQIEILQSEKVSIKKVRRCSRVSFFSCFRVSLLQDCNLIAVCIFKFHCSNISILLFQGFLLILLFG